MAITPWTRPFYEPGGASAQVQMWVFSDTAPPDPLPISAQRHGVPGTQLHPSLRLETSTAEEDPAVFRALNEEPGLSLARRDLGADFETWQRATICTRVSSQVADPPDLTYLQDGWAVVRCLCELGAAAVLSGLAMRWLRPKHVLGWEPDRPFHIRREISLVYETAPTPGIGPIMHTRGMAVFGRPDLILPGAIPADAPTLWRLAENLARGARPELGKPLLDQEGQAITLSVYQPAVTLPQLYLQNDALVVTRLQPSA